MTLWNEKSGRNEEKNQIKHTQKVLIDSKLTLIHDNKEKFNNE